MLKSLFKTIDDHFPALGSFLRRLLKGGVHNKSIRGKGNILKTANARLLNVRLDIIGDNNQIIIGEYSTLNNLTIRIRGSDHRIEIAKNCRISRGGVFWLEDDHCELIIGQKTTIVEASIAVTEPGSKVVIGENCMFANDIDIRVGDSHSVIDATSGKRINFAENISIGDHVWIAAHTVILKGVNIGENSVIASGAVVTRSCEPGAILAGNPAKVIKTGISWKRERIRKEDTL
jgi:acetyltransferase-like isoleucine patch superfamily enzyme